MNSDYATSLSSAWSITSIDTDQFPPIPRLQRSNGFDHGDPPAFEDSHGYPCSLRPAFLSPDPRLANPPSLAKVRGGVAMFLNERSQGEGVMSTVLE